MAIAIPDNRIRSLLRTLIAAALHAADPRAALHRAVKRNGDRLTVGTKTYRLSRYRRIIAIGAGKASAAMAQALEEVLGDRLDGGLVVVKTGHRLPTKRIEVVEAGHPVPDQAGARATERLDRLVGGMRKNDLFVCLLSGGASSLLPAPASGLTLHDKQTTTSLLLKSGATIQEINAVRKHLSRLKGGRLLQRTEASVLSLIVSDVVGDDMEAIGSGPTAPDSTTYADAIAVLKNREVWASVPDSVRAALNRGCAGINADTPKPGDPVFRRVHNHVLINNRVAVDAAARAARRAGLRPLVLTTTLTGEAREAAKVFGAVARELVQRARPVRPPCCVIAGGETTVTVVGPGRGGRAQEFALAAAVEIAGLRHVWIAAIGTDGTDGPTEMAGAIVTGDTMERARRAGLDPHRVLSENDSYTVLKRLGLHITTGPTNTNVNDLYMVIAR